MLICGGFDGGDGFWTGAFAPFDFAVNAQPVHECILKHLREVDVGGLRLDKKPLRECNGLVNRLVVDTFADRRHPDVNEHGGLPLFRF